MNLIQTLYINGSARPLIDSFGWAAPEYHLMSWALSCLQLRKFYPLISIHANSAAADLLIDTLKLPYDNVYITHDDLHLLDPQLWAFPKIHTYSLQRSPFLHVDGDVFIFNSFDKILLENELIAQNVEEATDYYTSTQCELMRHFSYFPVCVEEDFKNGAKIRAVNAGILGGNNINFINNYTVEARSYINNNLKNLKMINVDRFNVFYEQHLFYSLAQKENLPIGLLFPDVIKDNEYKYLGNFHEVPHHKTYLHLLGHFKRDAHTCMQMAYKLRQLHPEYYYRIVDLFSRNKKSFFIDYPKITGYNNYKNYDFLHKEAHAQYEIQKPSVEADTNNNICFDETAEFNIDHFLIAAKVAQNNLEDLKQKIKVERDQVKFVSALELAYKENKKLDFIYLYGRDLDSINWHNRLFGPGIDTLNQFIVRCDDIEIIESEFDWACMFSHYTRVGVEHYMKFEFDHGTYYNLIVPEVNKYFLSIFDIDESEKVILDTISIPTQILTLLDLMRSYADEEAQKHRALLDSFFLTLIKQLVLKKAIKPVLPSKI